MAMTDRNFNLLLIVSVTLAIALFILIAMTGCSHETLRGLSRDDEYNLTQQQRGKPDPCERPDDVACKGPKP